MSVDEEPRNPKYVTSIQCDSKQKNCSSDFKDEMRTIKKALVGDDLRGGIVKDMSELKTRLSLVKTVVLPVALSIISAILVAWATTGFHIGG